LDNIERTSNLYVTKAVYAMLLGVGVVGPRPLTLIGALTIGIPSFFLRSRRTTSARDSGSFAAFYASRCPRAAWGRGRHLPRLRAGAWRDRGHARRGAHHGDDGAALIAFLVLSVIAVPLTTWRLALVWAMPALFAFTTALPFTRDFFALDPPPLIVWLAAFGIAALVCSFARLFLPPERPVGTGAPPIADG
jgi:cation-transporting ATPase E